MKLKNLAVAMLATTFALPLITQADVKIGGNITYGAFGDSSGVDTFTENGSEINVDASDKINGITYYGHTEIDFQGDKAAAQFQEVRIGMKGGFGELIVGETDNGCDQVDVGGTNDTWVTHDQGGCKSNDEDNIVYKRSIGRTTFAASHNLDDSHSSIGAKTKLGRVTVSGGYDALKTGDNVTLGAHLDLGRLKLGVRANSYDADINADDYDKYGANFLYTAGNNVFLGGVGSGSDSINDSWSLGYQRKMGKKTTFIAEIAEEDGEAETKYGVGLKHNF